MRLRPSMRMSETTKGSNANALAVREASRISAAIRVIVGSVGLFRGSGPRGRSINACGRDEPCRESKHRIPSECAIHRTSSGRRGRRWPTDRRVEDDGDAHHDSKVADDGTCTHAMIVLGAIASYPVETLHATSLLV